MFCWVGGAEGNYKRYLKLMAKSAGFVLTSCYSVLFLFSVYIE